MKKNWLLLFLLFILLVAMLFAWQLYSTYLTTFGSNLLANPPATQTDWGVMGDFFGGTLNPIFSFLGLVMLLVTLFQNQKELELSRVELKESNEALTAQASTLEKQRFEDTFFALLDQLSRVLERLQSEGVRYGFDGNPSTVRSTVASLKEDLIGGMYHAVIERENSLSEAKKVLLAYDPLLNQYFRILYQVLKFIAVSSPATGLRGPFVISALESSYASPTEKFYSNLARSFVPETVYYLLAVNCFSENDSDPYYPYKLLVERYEFLEHMPLEIPEHQNRLLVQKIIAHYKIAAFGRNPEYKQGI